MSVVMRHGTWTSTEKLQGGGGGGKYLHTSSCSKRCGALLTNFSTTFVLKTDGSRNIYTVNSLVAVDGLYFNRP